MASKIYWKEREEEQRKHYITEEAEYQRHINDIYNYMMDQIQKEINGFYTKYAKKEGITLSEAKKRVSKLDMEEYGRKAAKYVKEKDFSKDANEEMRLYNATMKINRLEVLKANIGLELVDGFNELQKYYDEILTDRTLEEFERQAGILGDTIMNNAQAAHAIVNASFHNAKYSDRIWMYQDMLKTEIDKLLRQGLIQGKHPRELARHLEKLFGVSKGNAERLMRTELARVQVEAQMQSFEQNGYEEYEFIALGFSACEECRKLDGKHFKVKDRMPGENAPPMHPNCRCSTAAYVDEKEYEEWLDFLDTGGTTEEWGNQKKNKMTSQMSLMKLAFPEDMKKISGMTPEMAKEIENALKKLQEQYEIHLDSIEIGEMNKGDIFGAGPYLAEDGKVKFGLVINQKVDYNKIVASLGKQYEMGKFAGKSIEDYIAHEMAHIMTYQDCTTEEEFRIKKSIISKLFIEGISGYADVKKDGDESLAEAFVRFRNGEKIPSKAEVLVRAYIERWKK